jgi:hypothetical protein
MASQLNLGIIVCQYVFIDIREILIMSRGAAKLLVAFRKSFPQ